MLAVYVHIYTVFINALYLVKHLIYNICIMMDRNNIVIIIIC